MGLDELVAAATKSLVSLARNMADARRSYVPFDVATEEAAKSFLPLPPPDGMTWLDVLRRNSLLRLDPNPCVDADDPLAGPADVVRFPFQRFQDHLIADALLADIGDAKEALADGGALAFIEETTFQWEWRGLIEALSIQMPERCGQEFVDALPGGASRWWSVYSAQEAFLESVRWRSADAFTDRTRELFNRLEDRSQAVSRLVELSASIDHPWNAMLIHRNLMSRRIGERDAFWTAQLNVDCRDDDGHPVHRLIDWCIRADLARTEPSTIHLCGITIAWLFTLSNRPVRDRATKALARLLVVRPSLLAALVRQFEGTDDPYVWERLFGAAYGAACNDTSPTRLRDYAELAAETIFLRRDVPENLVLRDYGRGLLQLAEYHGVLPPNVALKRCRPPYPSRPPRFDATREEVDALAAMAGDRSILHSCVGWGDFARYEVEPALRPFIANRLTRPAPVPARGRYEAFEREVVGNAADRGMAWELLKSATSGRRIRIRWIGSGEPDQTTEEERRATEAVEAAERVFEGLLTPVERRRYRNEARGFLGLGKDRGAADRRRIDVKRAQLWVARRAYKLGRAAKSFPWSQRSMGG